MIKVVSRSVRPIYAVSAVWILFGLFFPMYRGFHFILAAACSAAVYLGARKLWPGKVLELPEPEPKPTGNGELDAFMRERYAAIKEMRRLNENIEDETISMQIEKLEATTKKISDYVLQNPGKLAGIKRFMNYYLPTTLKLLNAYDRMGEAGVDGTHITATMRKVEDMMDSVVLAFERQLDALFSDEAMDISTDITVMENMLAREGLGGIQIEPNI